MAYTKKDKVLFDMIIPEEKDTPQVIPNIETGYLVLYEGEEYIADTFEDISDYIRANFKPNTYDIYFLDADGNRNFYASLSFSG